MTDLPERPFFIVGHPRSGTTLLRFILSSHPRLYIPEETGFIPFLDTDPAAHMSREEVASVVARIGSLNHLWQGLGADGDALYEALPAPTLAHLLDQLYRRHITGQGRAVPFARWGDKTPGYINYLPTLDRIFPESQFIHVIRDGRDAALSARQKWPERRWYMSHYYLLRHWAENVTAGRAAGQQLGSERYLELRYETLVQAPEETIRRVCAFLQEPFSAAMLDHTGLARQLGPGPQQHTEVQKPVTTASVGRWKQEMDPFLQKMADQLAGPVLTACGYPLANAGPLSPAERARLLWAQVHFQLLNSGRSLLYKAGLLTLNRGMRRGER